jgi:hypothetical protein
VTPTTLPDRRTAIESPVPELAIAFETAKTRLRNQMAQALGAPRSAESREATLQLYLACMAAPAQLAAGDREGAKDLLRLLARQYEAENGPPDLIPAFLRLVNHFVRWTGDETYLGGYATGIERARVLAAQSDKAVGVEVGLLAGEDRLTWRDDDPAPSLRRLLDIAAVGARHQAGEADANEVALVAGVIEGLWGVTADALRGAVSLEPWLPPDWPAATLHRLRVGGTTLSFRLRRSSHGITLLVERQSGPRLTLHCRLRNPGEWIVLVDGEPLGAGRAVFEVTGEHEVGWHS